MNTIDKKPHQGQTRACCGMWGIILLGLLPLLAYAILTAMGGILIVGDPLQKSDWVVLLGGGDDQRLEEAVRLYKDRYGNMLVLTETGEVDPRSGVLYSTLQKEQILSLGVPDGGIIFTPRHGNSTYEEAVAVRKMASSTDRVSSIIVVTDPYHTLRTRLIYRDVFRGSKISVYVRPVRGHWYRSTTWWQSRAGWGLTLEEYAKIFAYFAGIKKD